MQSYTLEPDMEPTQNLELTNTGSHFTQNVGV
jgi:hypothetical protein